MTTPAGTPGNLFSLEYPQSIGIFNSYAEAQQAVDYLADRAFPVSNLVIVGTDLKLVERVTGRKTWGTVLRQGIWNGLSTGLMIAVVMLLLNQGKDLGALLAMAVASGVLIGVLFAGLGYAMTGGKRDFNSVTETVASRYELLCEHKVAQQAWEMLAASPQGRAALWNAGGHTTLQHPPAPRQPSDPGTFDPQDRSN